LFYEFGKRYFHFLELEDLEPESSGIRPLLQSPEETVKDFVISHEDGKGFPGLINLIGIESPGFTSSLAIGRYVKELVNGI
jgi:2-hydroxyglutarate dehydrogenase